MPLVQIVEPHDVQGRALSILNTLTGVAAPIGLGVATPFGSIIGIRCLYMLLGIDGTLVCFAGFMSPILRHVAKNPDAESLQ